MSQSVARLICDSLEAHDVDQVYCVPGESYIGLTSTMVERNSIRVVVCRHEGGAGFMAAADGRLRNRAGVAMVSRGPGLSNGIVALHSAYHDATPLVMLIGQVERKGYTLIPTAMYWSRGRVKVEIALAKGKKQHDKRRTEKERDWQREKGRILKQR